MVEFAVLEKLVLWDRFLNCFLVKMANRVFDPCGRLNYMMIKYINWLPRWGGMIHHNTFGAEARFHKKRLGNKFFLETNQDLISESSGDEEEKEVENQRGDPISYISPRQPMRPVEEDD